MEVTLNILWLSEEDMSLLDAGLSPKTKLEDCPIKEYTFYNIDFIRPHTENKNYSVISVGQEEYITNMSYNNLKKHIRKNIMFLFN